MLDPRHSQARSVFAGAARTLMPMSPATCAALPERLHCRLPCGLARISHFLYGRPGRARAAFASLDQGNPGYALRCFQWRHAVGRADPERRRPAVSPGDGRDLTRLGSDHPMAREHRRRLAAALNSTAATLPSYSSLLGGGWTATSMGMPERLGLLDPRALLIARADVREGAGAQLASGTIGKGPRSLLPSDALSLERVQTHLAGLEGAALVVLSRSPSRSPRGSLPRHSSRRQT